VTEGTEETEETEVTEVTLGTEETEETGVLPGPVSGMCGHINKFPYNIFISFIKF